MYRSVLEVYTHSVCLCSPCNVFSFEMTSLYAAFAVILNQAPSLLQTFV